MTTKRFAPAAEPLIAGAPSDCAAQPTRTRICRNSVGTRSWNTALSCRDDLRDTVDVGTSLLEHYTLGVAAGGTRQRRFLWRRSGLAWGRARSASLTDSPYLFERSGRRARSELYGAAPRLSRFAKS